ncbi:sensor histidine kinase [Streptomyces erythrochromogenes]|uniref:sensor histidine kinase n=1 Tax=Streptomyces erythrochromogenes TaxID=285574 RepID=UPI002257933D|nr:sensor histidine kinase [Streptomyces erythrochromogenes]MCX5583663.1 sensor histidine kinase [Streptomyces erythrochromogenes]
MGKGADMLRWTRNDALVAIGAAAADLLGFSVGTQTEGMSLTLSAAGALVAAAMCLLARRSRPVAVLAAVLALGVVPNVVIADTSPHFPLGLAVALYSVVRFSRPAVAAAAVALTVPLASAGQGGTLVPSGLSLAANAAAAALVAGTALVINRWQRDVAANQARQAERAVAEERRRIARELHDIVAHHITAMQLMAGGARANLAHDTEAARDALVILEDSGRIALREMRQLLDVLRAGEEPDETPPAPQPGAADLERIVTESRLAGTETEFTVDGPVRPLPPSVGLTLFRIVQEALTNTRKHAGQARARVRVTYHPDEVAVEVCDDGAGAPPPTARPAAGTGYGLIGMHERVALQGGTLEAAARDGGGFRVAARLPVPAGRGGEGGERHR